MALLLIRKTLVWKCYPIPNKSSFGWTMFWVGEKILFSKFLIFGILEKQTYFFLSFLPLDFWYFMNYAKNYLFYKIKNKTREIGNSQKNYIKDKYKIKTCKNRIWNFFDFYPHLRIYCQFFNSCFISCYFWLNTIDFFV